MNETVNPAARRILVAIDTSPHGSAALEAAARLATELRAELHGLFIEDINLLRLAGLPFASEIDCSSGVCRPLDIEAMERTLRTNAAGVRRAIEETARRTSLQWSFRVFRGNVARAMLTESLEADMCLIGRDRASPVPSQSDSPRGPVMIVDEGTRSSDHVFEAALRLARQQADTVVAIIMDNAAEAAEKYMRISSTCYVQRCDSNANALLKAVQQWRPQLLLLDRSGQFVTESTFNTLMTRLSCPLVLVAASRREHTKN